MAGVISDPCLSDSCLPCIASLVLFLLCGLRSTEFHACSTCDPDSAVSDIGVRCTDKTDAEWWIVLMLVESDERGGVVMVWWLVRMLHASVGRKCHWSNVYSTT